MEFQAYDLALIPMIMALVELVKKSGLPARFLPLVTLLLGQAGAFVYLAPGDPKKAVLAGIVMALAAMGTWSGAKTIAVHDRMKSIR